MSDKGAKEAITIGQQRVESMALVHKNLYQGSNLASLEMKEYIRRLADNLIQSYAIDGKDINVILDMEKTEMDVDTVIPLGLIINELITNALKYAFPMAKQGILIITLKTYGDDGLSLKVKDNGIGNHNKNQGFGTKLIRLLTKQIGASYTDGNDEGYWCLIERQPK